MSLLLCCQRQALFLGEECTQRPRGGDHNKQTVHSTLIQRDSPFESLTQHQHESKEEESTGKSKIKASDYLLRSCFENRAGPENTFKERERRETGK